MRTHDAPPLARRTGAATAGRRIGLGILAPVAGALACAAAPVVAATTTYIVRTVAEPAASGLPVSGELRDYVATSKARFVVPATWRRMDAPAGRLRFLVTQSAACRYDVTYAVTSALDAPGSAVDRVTAALPAAGPRYVLDSGTHDARAFRVVRRPGTGGQVRVDGLWAGVLTRRADIAPSGQVAWTQIRVTARSRAGSECHSGTYRESLGPAIGDSLAVARSTLRFVRAD